MDPLFADFQSLSSMSMEKADKNVQEALNYLRLDFRNLGSIISQYHPLEVLKMAAWEERRVSRTKAREPIAAAAGRPGDPAGGPYAGQRRWVQREEPVHRAPYPLGGFSGVFWQKGPAAA